VPRRSTTERLRGSSVSVTVCIARCQVNTGETGKLVLQHGLGQHCIMLHDRRHDIGLDHVFPARSPALRTCTVSVTGLAVSAARTCGAA
jgi:hypothetical protein